MNKFQRGKVYTIRSNITPLVYVGSTIEPYLSNRMREHRYKYNAYKKGNKKYCSSYVILELDGDAYIELYEHYPCESQLELRRREGEVIRLLNSCNEKIAGRTRKEHYNDNKEKLRAKSKQYRGNNKEKIKQRNNQYRKNNKDKIRVQVSQKHNCECGGKYTQGGKARHFKTKKHQRYLSTKTD